MKQTINQKSQRTAELLKALAHPLRIRIVLQLTQQDSLNVTALQNLLNIELSLLSRNLIIMRNQGFLNSTRKGREIYYSLANPRFIKAVRLLLPRTLTL